MIRLLIYAFLIYVGYRLFKAWGGSLLGSSRPNADEPADLAETELIRDPQCGVYFMKQHGIAVRSGGQTLHFCSTACRDKYLEENRRS
jgi:hypothetical protein